MSRFLPFFLLLSVSARAEEPAPSTHETPATEPTPAAPEPAVPIPTEPGAHTTTPAPGIDPQDIEPPFHWAMWLGGGLTFVLLEDTRLGDQLRDAGYTFDVNGPALSLSIERDVLDWLVVGGTLDLRWVDGERDDAGLSSELLPRLDMSLWRVGAGAYAQATLCLEYRSCNYEGAFFGALVGASVGPTLWNLRDNTEVALFVRLDLALTWYFAVDHFLLAMRLGHALLWQSGLGPNDLGHGFEWSPTTEIRMGWRW